VEKSLVTEEEEKTIDNRVRAINEAQRYKEFVEIINTMLFTISPEYQESSRHTPISINEHPKFSNKRRR
jgi:hypothetical protein